METILLHAVVSVLLYLLPVAVLCSLCSRRAPADPIARALEVPIALGLDAMLTVTLCHVMTLDRATLITRLAYVVIAVVATATGRARWRVSPAFAGVFAACALLVANTYQRISYELILWDRWWHIPLVSSLRASRLPFENTYLPRAPLRYHWLGDVIPSMLQTLSGDRIHSALALSLAHDLYLTLTASMVAWVVLFSAGVRRWWIAAMAPALGLAATLGGPFVLLNVPFDELRTVVDSGRLCGVSYLNYATLAYRPHVVVAGFFITAVLVALVVRTRHETRATESTRSTATFLLSAAALALLDEASLAIVPCALGLCWLAVPTALHPRRLYGLLIVFAMLAALPVVSRAYGASLAEGGPAHDWSLVPTRHIELFAPPIPLTDRARFEETFSLDYLPCYGVALLALALAVWTRRRDLSAVAVFYAALCTASWIVAFRVEVNHKATESHRFITAMVLLSPVVGAYAIAAAREAVALRALIALVVASTAASTLAWRDSFHRHRLDRDLPSFERSWIGARSPYPIDCATVVGRRRRVVTSVYIDLNQPMLYVGCEPTLTLGQASEWGVSIGPPLHEYNASSAYRNTGAEAPAEVVCNTRGPIVERGCAWARENLRCTPAGEGEWTRCALPAARAREFVEHVSW